MRQQITLTLLFFGTLFPAISNAQCGFDVARTKLRQNPEYILKEQEFENKIQSIIRNKAFNQRAASVYTIPVVVHVLHLGEAEGSGTNISDTQIQSGIDRLNEVYRGLDPASPIDFEVEFALAQRDPDCNSTTGINRVDASSVPNYTSNGVYLQSSGADENTLKDLSRWPETDYFNIWIVSEIDNNNGGAGIQGYANFYYGSAYEGSVMMYTVFGYDPTNAQPSWPLTFSRDNSTVIHEFGHYFHLYHTFIGDNNNTTCPANSTLGTDSDGCADTEIHKRHTSTCPSNNECNSNNPYGFNTLKNYMSYFSCADRFTSDQKTRVKAALMNTSIINSLGAEAPDAGYAAPVSSCQITSPQTNNAGIYNVELNAKNMSSGSSSEDGGTIDESGNCSSYFEIDATITNTLNIDMFSVNYQQLGVWIDWNDDGDFDDDSEQQHLSEDIGAESTVSINLNYPTTIPYDDYVRLRLITDLDDRYGVADISTSCSTPTYGQDENYAIFIQPEVALPIELKSFEATSTDNNSVQIDWQTISEINNNYFTIERSKNGLRWEELGEIAGAPNSSREINYVYFDYNPYDNISYYRLKQTDFNGEYSYSQIEVIKLSKIQDSQVIIYPNPTSNQFTIEGSKSEIMNVNIYNILGQNITDLISKIQVSDTKTTFNLSNCKSGIYYIKTNSSVNKIYKQ